MIAKLSFGLKKQRLANMLLCRTNPEGYTRGGVIDIPHLFLLGMGGLEQKRALKNDTALHSALARMIDELPKDAEQVLEDPMEAYLTSLRLTQTIYLNLILNDQPLGLEFLGSEIEQRKKTICVISVIQLMHIFQCSRYALHIKRSVGQANFYRASFSGDIDSPVFSEYYLHHYLIHRLPEALEHSGSDLEAFFKNVYNLWAARDLYDDALCEITADRLGGVITKLEALVSSPVTTEALRRTVATLDQAYGDKAELSRLLVNAAWPAPSWLSQQAQQGPLS